MRLLVQDEQERKTELERASGLQAALLKVSQAVVEVGSADDRDELLRMLREWAASRERHHTAVEVERLATTCVDFDDKLLRTLIWKFIQVEKSLKELRKARKARKVRGRAS